MPLKAIAINCTLKPSAGAPEPSSTDRLLNEVLAALAEHDVAGELIRAADHDIKPGVTSDEGPGDAWPALRRKILAAPDPRPSALAYPCRGRGAVIIARSARGPCRGDPGAD